MEKKNELTIYEKQSRDRLNYLISEYCEGSQQKFSDRTGLNKASVSQYVNGKNTPSNITANKIAKAFHVDPAWVMGFDVSKAGETPAAVSENFSNEEKEIVLAYRRSDSLTKAMVLRALGLDLQEKGDVG